MGQVLNEKVSEKRFDFSQIPCADVAPLALRPDELLLRAAFARLLGLVFRGG